MYKINPINQNEVLMPHLTLATIMELQSGSEGVVFTGMISGDEDVKEDGFVAIKQVKMADAKEDKDNSAVYNEAYMLHLLSPFNHPNIVKYIGFYRDNTNYYIVTEYIDGSDMFDYCTGDHYRSLTSKQKHEIIMQITLCVQFLHSLNIAHMDIKLENIMIDNNDVVKFIDFSQSVTNVKDGDLCNTTAGTLEYADILIIANRPYNCKSADIWSWGIVIYLFLTDCDIKWTRSILNDVLGADNANEERKAMNKVVNLDKVRLSKYVHILKKVFVVDCLKRIQIDNIVDLLKCLTWV